MSLLMVCDDVRSWTWDCIALYRFRSSVSTSTKIQIEMHTYAMSRYIHQYSTHATRDIYTLNDNDMYRSREREREKQRAAVSP